MNLTISKKLFLLSIFSASALILSSIYSLYNLRSTFQWIGEVYQGAAIIEEMNSDLGLPLSKLRELSLSIVMSPNKKQQLEIYEQSTNLIKQLNDYFDDAQAKYNVNFHPEEQEMYWKLLGSWRQYTKLVDYTAQHVLDGYREAAFINVNNSEKQQFELLFKQFGAWQKHKVSEAANFYANAKQNYQTVFYISILVWTVVTLAVFSVSFSLAKTITTSLQKAVNIMNTMSQGKLNIHITEKRYDEIGLLFNAMQQMANQLKQVVEQVLETAEQITTASQQLIITSVDLTKDAAEQAANIEETTSVLEEVSISISQTAENSKQSDTLAIETREQAKKGGSAVENTMQAMQKIAEKVDIIQNIAYKTNILALNAAIEAARVGEQGKGFAVVAIEVRKLAENSHLAADSINQLTQESVNISKTASELLSQHIIPSVYRTSDFVQEIASISDEQAKAIREIEIAMERIDNAAQKNAAASEEVSASAQMLDDQAKQLQLMMAFFQLNTTAS
ncbi:MAG: hypothetical protein RIT27_1409 [Pseudomonadota bacterium]|jgi:methyl-accepting chemotaxis protein